MSELVVSGKRISYIFGGVFCLLSAIVAGALFLPDLFEKAFGAHLWDLQGAIISSYDDSIVTSISMWGLRISFIILFVVYDISTCVRQSANSTCLRLAAIFGVLTFLLPEFLEMLSDLTDTKDLLQYVNIVRLICFIVAFGCFIAGIILRVIQKHHPERSSTLLVFNGAFWVLLAFFVAYSAVVDMANGHNGLGSISSILLTNETMLGVLAIFLLTCGIWMLCSIPHRIWRPTPDREYQEEEVKPVTAPINRKATAPQGRVRTIADVDEETKNASKYTSKKRTVSNPYVNSDDFKAIPVNRPRSASVTRKSGVEYVNSTSTKANRPVESGLDGPGFKGGNSGKKDVTPPTETDNGTQNSES